VLKHHPLLPFAHPKRQRRRHPHLRRTHHPLRRTNASSSTGTIVGWERNALRGRIGSEFFRVHEHAREVTRGPLGVDVVGTTLNGAEDDMGSRRGGLFLELFPLCEVLLSREAGLSFTR
jgi:hypothetical protein